MLPSIVIMYDRGRIQSNGFIVTELSEPNVLRRTTASCYRGPHLTIPLLFKNIASWCMWSPDNVRGYLRVIGFLLNIELKYLFEIISDRFSPFMTRKIQLYFFSFIQFFTSLENISHLISTFTLLIGRRITCKA